MRRTHIFLKFRLLRVRIQTMDSIPTVTASIGILFCSDVGPTYVFSLPIYATLGMSFTEARCYPKLQTCAFNATARTPFLSDNSIGDRPVPVKASLTAVGLLTIIFDHPKFAPMTSNPQVTGRMFASYLPNSES